MRSRNCALAALIVARAHAAGHIAEKSGGLIGQLGNASFSVVSNEDYEGGFVTMSVACRVITAAAKALKGQTLDLHCRS